MSTPTEIVNLALMHLRKGEINDINDGSAEGRVARRAYDSTRRTFLSLSDWTFARRTLELAQLVTNPYTERWGYAFTAPPEALLVRSIIYGADPLPNPVPWRFELQDGVVYADVAPAKAVCTIDQMDLTRWHPLALDAFAYFLAERMAIPLTSSKELRDSMYQFRVEAMSLAVSADANQSTVKYAYDDENEVTLQRY